MEIHFKKMKKRVIRLGISLPTNLPFIITLPTFHSHDEKSLVLSPPTLPGLFAIGFIHRAVSEPRHDSQYAGAGE